MKKKQLKLDNGLAVPGVGVKNQYGTFFDVQMAQYVAENKFQISTLQKWTTLSRIVPITIDNCKICTSYGIINNHKHGKSVSFQQLQADADKHSLSTPLTELT